MESPINMHTKGSNFLMGVFAILLITLIGFYRPYFGKLTTSEAISWVIHLHLIAFLCWFFVLIWQPILIRQKEFKLNRKVGKCTYILVPILVLTILNIVYFHLGFYLPGQSNDSVYINMQGGSL